MERHVEGEGGGGRGRGMLRGWRGNLWDREGCKSRGVDCDGGKE